MFRPLTAILAISLAAAACGDDADHRPDAGAPGATVLLLEGPDIVGLGLMETQTLSFRYETATGERIAEAPVTFALTTVGDERTGGATLSVPAATTDAVGIVRVNVRAGLENASFRVTAQADGATAFYYVNVSEDGFVDLAITPVHEGEIPEAAFDQVELRLYRAQSLRCADVDFGALPPASLPPRTLAGFGGQVSYRTLSAGVDYTLVAWASEGASEQHTAEGCVDIGATQTPPTPVRLEIVVADRLVVLGETHLISHLDLAPVAVALADRGAEAAWQILACPRGPGQLLLDCALDAAASDGVLDCVPTGSSALTQAITARRGLLGGDGCRGASVGGSPSLDAQVTGAVADGLAPDAVDALLTRRDAVLTELRLASLVSPRDPRLVDHALQVAGAGAGEAALIDPGRPVLLARTVAYEVEVAGERVSFAAHGFTLRLADLARQLLGAAVADDELSPDTLATDLAAAALDGNQQGCAAISALVCGEIGQSASCLEAACATGAPAGDSALAAWLAILSADGLDLELSGEAPFVRDTIAVTALGGDETTRTGTWSARVRLSDGTWIPLPGDFGQTQIVAE